MGFEFERSFVFYLLFSITLILSLYSVFVSYGFYKHTLRPISGYSSSEQATISFSVESEVNETVTGSSSGGGGGGAVAGAPGFKLNKDSFSLQIVSVERETDSIIVENTGLGTATITVSVTGIGSYISFNANTLIIPKGGKFPLTFIVTAPEPGVYAGKIILNSGGITHEVLVLLNVVSEGVLFDTTVTVPDLYRVLNSGDILPVLIELTQVGAETGNNVTMKYVIKDFDGKIHYTESETFYIMGAKSYDKKFSTAGLNPGDYVLGVELTYPGGFATSSAHFKISTSEINYRNWIALGALLVTLLVIVLSVVFYRRHQAQQVKFKSLGKVK